MSTDPSVAQLETSEPPWLSLIKLAEQRDGEGLQATLESMAPSEQAHALGHLEDAQLCQVFEVLSPENAAELLGRLSELQTAQMVSVLEPQAAAAVIQELPSDEQADVIGDLDEELAEAILEALPTEEAAEVRDLSAYEDDVAGGLMVREFLRFSEDDRISDVLEELSSDHERYDRLHIRYGYVCDAQGRLIGVLPMNSLLFAKRSEPVRELMVRHPVSVQDSTDLEELIDVFASYSFLAVPVVSESGDLLGVVEREAVDRETVRAVESAYMKSQGIVGGEELRSMPLLLRSRRRLSWLSVNIVLNIGAAAVIATYQETLKSAIALAVFLPIISDMSGCSGNQSVAVSMRELSLGLIRPGEFLRVWMQELAVGLINGIVLGALVGAVAFAYDQNLYLGLVVGVALFVNTMIAVSIGGTIPLLLKRLNVDPAIASGPLLTTVTDMCGFFLVLGIASTMLSRLG